MSRFGLPRADGREPPTSPLAEIARLPSVRPGLADWPLDGGDAIEAVRRARAFPDRYLSQAERARARGGAFAERVIRPAALEIERRAGADPTYFAWDVLREAAADRLLSLMVPRGLGGRGYLTLAVTALLEELATGCAGLATTIGVHNIAAGLIPDPYLLAGYVRPMVEAERRGEPVLFSGAITEPGAGTDVWDRDFLARGTIGTRALPVAGGYRLSGRKCFISNGSVARWTVLAAPVDPRRPAETWSLFLVSTRADGFSVGRIERKLGQKASPAAELVLDDVFVPAERRICREGDGARLIAIYLAASRGPVGAIGVGCARRALECLIEWASQRRDGGGRLVDQQWLQMRIAAMAREIHLARAACAAACMACDAMLARVYDAAPVRAALALLPSALLASRLGRRIAQSPPFRQLVARALDAIAPPDALAHASALAAIAKIVGSDCGVAVSGEALRIMGPDAYAARWPVEKCYRDAKLTQIYEGTNQANAITQLKCMVANLSGPADPDGRQAGEPERRAAAVGEEERHVAA